MILRVFSRGMANFIAYVSLSLFMVIPMFELILFMIFGTHVKCLARW